MSYKVVSYRLKYGVSGCPTRFHVRLAYGLRYKRLARWWHKKNAVMVHKISLTLEAVIPKYI